MQCRAYSEKHKEQRKAYMNSWRKQNATADTARNRRYKKKHFFIARASIRDYKVTPYQIFKLWVRQKGRCALTSVKLSAETAQLDHVVPRALGGTDTIENLRWLHAYVNRAIGATHDDEAFLHFIQEAAQKIRVKDT